MIDKIRQNKNLIWGLAKNDFKAKFAGSYFGILWAFVQPVTTVLIYWFVFQKALPVGAASTRSGIEVPYVLWLIAGLVPWFYFSDLINSGTNTFLEYSYLVKKVVFDIEILPVVKSISGLFVHFFFLAFTVVLYGLYGNLPNLYTVQMLYYSFCMFILGLGIIYMTSALVSFFRDLTQVINILLQVLMWMTPIMWNIQSVDFSSMHWVEVILKLNPMYYVVIGYRDSLIDQVAFWQRPTESLVFWCITILIFAFGRFVFKRLKPHLADVL